jgi:hypothetical protein
MMICVVPGVVLAAAYMLRMLQRVAYGGTRNPDHSHLKDLGLREIVTLAPLLVFVFWIGLHPEPFTRVLHASVERLLNQAQGTAGAVVVAPQETRSEVRSPKSEVRSPINSALDPLSQNETSHLNLHNANVRSSLKPLTSILPLPRGEGRGALVLN